MKKFLLVGVLFLVFVFCLIIAFVSGWFISNNYSNNNGNNIGNTEEIGSNQEKVKCELISPLVSNTLAKELKNRADKIVIEKVGQNDFDKYYSCTYIGFNYVTLPEGSALEKYSRDYYYNSAFMHLIIAYRVEMKEESSNTYENTTLEKELAKKHYYEAPYDEKLDIFYNDVKYATKKSDIFIAFIGITPDTQVSTKNFPTYQKFKSADVTAEQATQTAQNMLMDTKNQFYEYEKSSCGLGDFLNWDESKDRFYWTISLITSNNKCVKVTVWADKPNSPRIVIDKYVGKIVWDD
jgi:hypothetical protein